MIVFLRSLIFNIAFFSWTAFLCVALSWALALPRSKMMRVVCWYMKSVSFLEQAIVGIRYDVRGREYLPQTGCFLVAAKHQSAWETMKLLLLLDDPAVVLKRELMKLPVWGWFAAKAEMIPVDRGAPVRALKSLIAGARKVKESGRPIVIFPQGTRTAIGERRPYRVGIGVLYEHLKVPIIPMAVNSGLYWPRNGFLKRPGTILVEFLPPIDPGLERFAAMLELETRLEAATDALVAEAQKNN
ncbi:1-acyl-sn-glycerol-3-phosphate acyltransferase [Azospirillaceae bacterium]